MPLLPRAGPRSALPARIVLALASAFAVVTAVAQGFVATPAWRFDSPVQFDADFAVAVGLAWTLCQAIVHRRSAPLRRRWLVAVAAMLLLAAIQATDWLVDSGRVGDDWLLDLPLWAVVAALVHGLLRSARANRWAMRAWQVGLCLQLVDIVCDFGDGRLVVGWLGTPGTIASIIEWAELLAIESYVVALVLLEIAPAAALRRAVLAAGAEARRLFEAAGLFRKASYPPLAWAHWPGMRQALVVAASLALLVAVGPRARRASGRSLRAQLSDLLLLGLRDRFDPLSYYLQDLHFRGGRAEAAQYLTRYETKNGLLHALNGLGARPHGGDELNDKLLFADCCRLAGVPTPPVLLAAADGEVVAGAPRAALDRDLCCKPRRGRGAHGIAIVRRVAAERFRAQDGATLDLDALIERLREASRAEPLVVQPRLDNHGEIADLAERSLVTFRVVTCLDPAGRPVVTHGVLRLLSKLEPDWPGDDEYGAPIELATGTLGAVRSDRLLRCAMRWSRHPVLGQRVEGRRLAVWPALHALALAAHAAFAHRTLVGWDLAATPDGPVVLEGNNSLDVMFPQRVYREGFGRGPLGPLLQHHLAALARARGVE
jgi:hypothetical protein